MFMLKARSRVVDVPGVVRGLTGPLLFVAVMLALLVSAGVAYAQGTPTVPTIESVTVTSEAGEDGGYAIGDEIQVGLDLQRSSDGHRRSTAHSRRGRPEPHNGIFRR